MNYLIIGGVAGGATAAARLRRIDEHARIVLIERGPYISFANCGLPYHLSGTIAERAQLLVTTEERFEARYRIDVRTGTEAVAIDRARHQVVLRDVASGRTVTETYDRLLLSPGAEALRPPLPGIDSPRVHTLRNIPDLDRIVRDLDGARRAVVVGGGAHVDAVTRREAFGGGHQQLLARGDGARQVVGQAAIGETDVGAALDEHDLRGLVETAQARRRGGAAGDAADDHDLHGLTFERVRLHRASAHGARLDFAQTY